jgi:hypothetical protein
MAETTIKIGPWEWTKWPTFPLPTETWLRERGAARGASWLHEFHKKRETAIANEQNDPLAYGWEQPPMKILRALLAGTYTPGMLGTSVAPAGWKQNKTANDIVLLGGNGSGKTEIQGKIAMEILESKESAEARCFSQNEMTSVRYIQRALFKYLRPELRKVKSQGTTTKISYKESTGFSENVFILPPKREFIPGSACLFPTYKAYEQDKKSVEGGECDVGNGAVSRPQEIRDHARRLYPSRRLHGNRGPIH